MDISKKLIGSCEALYSKNLLNDEQYVKCKKSINDEGYFDKLKATEMKIFRNDRNSREKKYNDFVLQVETLVKNVFEKIHRESATTSEYNIPKSQWDNYYDLLVVLNSVIIEVIENVIKKSVKRYKNKENTQYNKLLELYNVIDKNRKEMLEIEQKFKTYEEMRKHKKSSLEKVINERDNNYSIFCVLLLINIVFLVILILVIKFK